MNLWDIVTSNSTLPVQAGTTFWDHLNNQDGAGAGDTIIGALLTADVNMSLTADVGEVLNSNLLMDTLTANIVEDLSSEATINLKADI